MGKKRSRPPTGPPHAVIVDGAAGEHSRPLAGDAVLFLDSDGRITVWSASAEAMTGIPAREALGRPVGDFCPDIETQSVLAEATRRGYAEFAGRCVRGEGGFMPVRATISPSHDPSGTLIGFAAVLTDGQAPAAFALRAADGSRGGEPAFADSPTAPALLVDSVDRHILDASPAALAGLGCDIGDLVGRSIDEVLRLPGAGDGDSVDGAASGPDRRVVRHLGAGGLERIGIDRAHGQSRESALHVKAGADSPGWRIAEGDSTQPGSGPERVFEFSVLDVVSEGRETLLYYLHDVTHWVEERSELTRVNLELSHLSRHDHLTGLFNKPMFIDTLELANSRLERTNGLLGVLYIDLDGFKPVNDQHGHDTGDRVLVEIGGRLRGAVRTSDVMARLGGDEFGAILENLKTPRDALKVAKLLIKVLSEPIVVDGKHITISASVGAVVANRRVPDSAWLLNQADRMMYRAKRRGRGRAALEYLGETGALRDALL